MPVEKFRSFEAAADAMVTVPEADGERPLPERIAALWDLSAQLTSPLGLRGVYKFRSIEESNAQREQLIINRSHGVR
ncbi:MAG: hypothetical protein AMXMBFR57_22710 [Acidimicrobiia bacterium]